MDGVVDVDDVIDGDEKEDELLVCAAETGKRALI